MATAAPESIMRVDFILVDYGECPKRREDCVNRELDQFCAFKE